MRLKWVWMILGILLLDGASKGLVHSYFKPFELSSPVFPFGGMAVFQAFGIDFCLHHVTNKGMAWGVGGQIQNLILIARLVIVGGLCAYLFSSAKAQAQKYSLILIVAGGLGNILDYFIYGHVIDLFHFIFWGYSYPVFNVADASIFLGVASLLLKSFKKEPNAV